MLENRQTDQLQNGSTTPDDEIELIDLLRVLWKWKYLIIGGTILFAVAAATISLNMTKIYSVDMIVEPGILNILSDNENEGKRVYIDSPQNIKALIDVGSFENQILKFLETLPDSQNLPQRIQLETNIPKSSNSLKVSYETSNVKQGIQILNQLTKLLLEKYNNLIEYYKKDFEGKIQLKTSNIAELSNKITNVENTISTVEVEYDNKIRTVITQISKSENQISNVQNDIATIDVEYNKKKRLNETEISKISNDILKVKNDISTAQSDTDAAVKQKANMISTISAQKEAKREQIKNLQKRVQEIQSEMGRVNNNTDLLIEERNKLLALTKNENNILSSVMYINTIQQNIGYLNSLKNEIYTINNQIFQTNADIEKLENEIRDLDIQKQNLGIQTDYKTENLKVRINNLEAEINDLKNKNETMMKDKGYEVDNLKSQINDLEAENKELQVRKENLMKQKTYEIATLLSQIKDLENQKKFISEEIKILEFKKDNVQNLQILKHPTGNAFPIKPKTRINVLLAGFMGVFFFVCLSFLFEHILNINKKAKINKE